MSTYRMDAAAARGLLADYLAEDDEEVTSQERVSALADALHDALREIEGHREDALGWRGNPQVAPAPPTATETGLVFVTFRWSTEHGPCFECAAPAAWLVWCYGEDHEPAKACAVCACNHAAEGSTVRHIDPDLYSDED